MLDMWPFEGEVQLPQTAGKEVLPVSDRHIGPI